MTSPTGSIKSALIEKSFSKDKNNDKTGVDEKHTSSPNSDHPKPLSSTPTAEQVKVLEDKAKKVATQGREAVAAKSQEKAQVQENIQVMAKRLRAVFGDGSRPYKPRKRLCDVFGDVPNEESHVSVSSDK